MKCLHYLILTAALVFSINIEELHSQENIYAGIEFNKTLCGYQDIIIKDSLIEGKNMIILHQEVFFDFSALGRDLSQYQRFTYHIDPISGNFDYHKSYHKQPDHERGGEMKLVDGKIHISSGEENDDQVFDLPENVILQNTFIYKYLSDGFRNSTEDELTFKIFDMRFGKIIDKNYKRIGEEMMNVANQEFDVYVIIETIAGEVSETKLWIDKNTGRRIRMESAQKLNIFLADPSVKWKMKKGSWDDVILVKTNKYIDDIRGIKAMKVKARLSPNPKVEPEDLQVPGQNFEGTITEGRIEGIFEVSYPTYSGKNAPSFPFPDSDNEEFARWLNPEYNVESDDPELISLAEELTKGSKNLWDAACSISHWVVENIDGSLFSGSAKETFNNGNGLCASQSYLTTALCRAAGIPSRVVWGCMYIHEMGGSFGHHGWNEVYMGEAGWIPIDVTSHEVNYVDSGHVRLGTLDTRFTQINFESMEILEYRTSKR